MHHLTSLDHLYYVQNHPNPFVRFGHKCFSQTDEDGILLEIIRRINPYPLTYVELGVGDGMECNTLVLEALGWRGQWIGNQKLVVSHRNYTDAFITKDNVNSLLNERPNVLSIDLDGNDYHILQRLILENIPDIIITEYNAKFPPPIEWVMPYNQTHVWDGSDYFGASLQSFVNLLTRYKLIACNAATGANAFFINKKYEHMFPEIPNLIRDIYVPPRYRVDTNYGTHGRAIATVQSILT